MKPGSGLKSKEFFRSGADCTLSGGLKGIEKESLRITRDGSIAQSPHPKAWGASLTHPFITTDYSESLPELITPPSKNISDSLAFLRELHHFLYEHMEPGEMLWCASMPCAVSDEKKIPIAEYGNSNVGRMKHIYRLGLDFRYGRRMQAISGVHFNYSLPEQFWTALGDYKKKNKTQDPQDFKNENYFGLIRNYSRMSWMIPLLFGCSPVVCKSFLSGNTSRFKKMLDGTYYVQNGTSLRMSDIGYKNKNQSALKISYDSLDCYLRSLKKAITTPYPEYETIGLYDGADRIQLSTNVLQIENEYYSSIRPKRADHPGQRPSKGLKSYGVEYVEMRALDVDMLDPYGIKLESLLFCEAFLIYCLLEESPFISEKELQAIEYNEITVALRGREPNLKLNNELLGKRQTARDWALEILEKMGPICEILSRDKNLNYTLALQKIKETIVNPDMLPSAKILQILADRRLEFQAFALDISTKNCRELQNRKIPESRKTKLNEIRSGSFERLEEMEKNSTESLEEYIEKYLAD